MRLERFYWTKERLIDAAKNCATKKEFRQRYGGAYMKACRLGVMNEICRHMIPIGDKYHRDVYVFEFDDNHAYVGLSYNVEKRKHEHLNSPNSSVYNHIVKTNSNYKFKKLTNKMVENSVAISIENYYIDYYANKGFNMLNRAKGGSLGGKLVKWDYSSIVAESLKYNTKIDFQNNSPSAYNKALKLGYISEICNHMIPLKKASNYWTISNIIDESKKYNKVSHFKKYSNGAFDKAKKLGILHALYEKQDVKESGHWNNINNIYQEVKKYKSISELKKNNESCYNGILRNNYSKSIKDYYTNI